MEKSEYYDRIRTLEKCNTFNWDGYGGRGISSLVIANVRELFSELSDELFEKLSISPTYAGTISFTFKISEYQKIKGEIGEAYLFYIDPEENCYTGYTTCIRLNKEKNKNILKNIFTSLLKGGPKAPN